VFGPNGEFTNPAEFWNDKQLYPADKYAQGYQNQLTFLNKKMEAAIDTILADSSTPPIIIIQGDHGFDTVDRMANMMAYYFPKDGNKALYSTITPVNSFRLVFNTYFGQKFPLLPDVSYYSTYHNRYTFTKVKYPCP
jgi:hypothetical protein